MFLSGSDSEVAASTNPGAGTDTLWICGSPGKTCQAGNNFRPESGQQPEVTVLQGWCIHFIILLSSYTTLATPFHPNFF